MILIWYSNDNNIRFERLWNKILYFCFYWRDLGWGDWIISPAKYRANFCRGECGLGLMLPESPYADVMQKSDKRVYSPCCSPRKMSDINIFYRDSDNNYHQKIFEDMTVEECGCS